MSCTFFVLNYVEQVKGPISLHEVYWVCFASLICLEWLSPMWSVSCLLIPRKFTGTHCRLVGLRSLGNQWKIQSGAQNLCKHIPSGTIDKRARLCTLFPLFASWENSCLRFNECKCWGLEHIITHVICYVGLLCYICYVRCCKHTLLFYWICLWVYIT